MELRMSTLVLRVPTYPVLRRFTPWSSLWDDPMQLPRGGPGSETGWHKGGGRGCNDTQRTVGTVARGRLNGETTCTRTVVHGNLISLQGFMPLYNNKNTALSHTSGAAIP